MDHYDPYVFRIICKHAVILLYDAELMLVDVDRFVHAVAPAVYKNTIMMGLGNEK